MRQIRTIGVIATIATWGLGVGRWEWLRASERHRSLHVLGGTTFRIKIVVGR